MKSQSAWVLACALVLAVPAIIILSPTATSAETTRTLTITQQSANPIVPFHNFDGNPPKVFDFNGDGQLEIIAQNDNQWVYIFDSKTGKILAQMTTVFPGGWGARTFNGPEAAVLVDGGLPRLIVMNSAAHVTMFRYDPASSTSTNYKFVKEWERRLTTCHSNPGSDSKPVLADLDKDGRLEIILTTEERGMYVLRSDGRSYWHKCVGGGNAEVTVGDLDRNGFPDIVHVSDGGVVSAFDGRTGNYLWAFDARVRYNLGSGSMPVGAAVAQLDGMTGPDVVVGARDSHDPENWPNNHALLLALSAGGHVLWAKQDPSAAPLTYTHAIIADAANDGQAEVYWADWNTVGHKPPHDETAWQVQGPGHAFRYDKAGNLVWKTRLDSYWHNKDMALADVDGDGVQEIVANGVQFGRDGLWYIDSRTGVRERHVDTYPYQVARGPVIADLWRTGTMQMVVQVGGGQGGGGPGIMIFNTNAPYNAKWPHLPYESRSRGTSEPTPTTSTSTPPGGTFGATFTIKSPNEWWQEMNVQPDTPRSIIKAEVRINGGAWQGMTWRTWGAWAASYHAPAGSSVEFKVTDSGGATSQSLPFKWMDGTTTRRSTTGSTTAPTTSPSPSPPPGGSFAATFEIKNPNEWWQQVIIKPDTARSITSVMIRVNGGSWKAMTSQPTWGTNGEWTSSQHTPKGSRVEFLATDSGGAKSQSQPFTWLDGTFTRRSTDGGGGSEPFSARFEPRAVGNDWWIEVAVHSDSTIASVDASINGGIFQPLSKTSWGTWAESIHAPNGSQVKFRATNSAGQSVTSSTYTWT